MNVQCNRQCEYMCGYATQVVCVHTGSEYNIPLSILLHPNHPERAPTVYVRPTPVMVVKPSSFVAPSGLVTLPYLTGWQQVNHF
jgi:hypothetical protein